jgi:hypothetical protein
MLIEVSQTQEPRLFDEAMILRQKTIDVEWFNVGSVRGVEEFNFGGTFLSIVMALSEH